jgi:transcription elongation factor Elf1
MFNLSEVSKMEIIKYKCEVCGKDCEPDISNTFCLKCEQEWYDAWIDSYEENGEEK